MFMCFDFSPPPLFFSLLLDPVEVLVTTGGSDGEMSRRIFGDPFML